MTLDEQAMTLDEHKQRAATAMAEHLSAARTVRAERLRLRDAKRAFADVTAAQRLLAETAAAVQAAAHEQIAAVVTRCLQTVYAADAYAFRIHFERRRGKTEARMVFVHNGHEINPVRAASGGQIDVAAFALRLAALLLSTPRRRRLLVLDEPFKNVHGADYQRRTAELVETLAAEMGVQFIIVTGEPWLKIGAVHEFGG